jgi:pimeloyl-ACP methyl ester carboxylesterase
MLVTTRVNLLIAAVTAVFFSVSLRAQTSAGQYDPVTMDQPAGDTLYRPGLAEVAVKSGGERLNGIVYVPGGRGPHPVAVMLHGNPGNEKNLDLAQAMRRSGIAVLFFNYRGSWGSGGTFSRGKAIQDVAAALSYLRNDSTAASLRIDPRRIALLGHSMGGWLALMGTAADPAVKCVGALDFVNTGARSRLLKTDRKADSTAVAALEASSSPGGPYRVESVAAVIAEMKANADRWDVDSLAHAFRSRPLLLISAIYPNDQTSFQSALNKAGAGKVTALAWNTDHSFSDRRIELSRTLIRWLSSECRL